MMNLDEFKMKFPKISKSLEGVNLCFIISAFDVSLSDEENEKRDLNVERGNISNLWRQVNNPEHYYYKGKYIDSIYSNGKHDNALFFEFSQRSNMSKEKFLNRIQECIINTITEYNIEFYLQIDEDKKHIHLCNKEGKVESRDFSIENLFELYCKMKNVSSDEIQFIEEFDIPSFQNRWGRSLDLKKYNQHV